MKNLLARLSALVLMSLSAQLCAYSFTGNIAVQVQYIFQVTQQTTVNFGLIPNTDGICTINKQRKLSGQCAGLPNGEIGRILVQGTPRQWINYSVGPSATVDGVTFVPLLASNNATSSSVKLSNAGAAIFDVIGSLQISNAIGGAKNLLYTINIDYQ